MQLFTSHHTLAHLVSCCLVAVLIAASPVAYAQPEPGTPDPLAEAQRLREQAAQDLAQAQALEAEHRAALTTPASPEEIKELLDDILEQGIETEDERQHRDNLQAQLHQLLNQGRQPTNMNRRPRPVPEGQPFAEWRNLLVLGEGFFVLDFRVIEPKVRVYFDIGSDDEGEIDLFRDGNLSTTINVFEVRLTRFLFDEDRLGYDVSGNDMLGDRSRWSWGINLGAGIGIPAQDSPDGTEGASNAPVVVFTIGLFIEIDLLNLTSEQRKKIGGIVGNNSLFSSLDGASPGAKFGIEIGYALGFSADESFEDVDDGALYFGLTFHVPF